ncbi:hypothetical protein [Haloarcula pellucida]|uniref:Uncharacterized protein n=1 Tax=Haloarcula pellucida TaxID=1427151 RepID=A0A830GRZ0_9EURY|nr:hypothetical protein [Halomicroarcula pellucida]MBX0350371.1 hypothetical protein [Halomicroarcula pellucida]GGO01733.1 hypothetical protein GCM10009030_35740 [Halomicroarcula pellucida]
MSKTKRRARDAIVGLLVALAPFAYKQLVLGNRTTAAVTAVAMAGLVLVYRYADARTIEAAAGADAEDLKPVLRRVGRTIRRRLPSGEDNS